MTRSRSRGKGRKGPSLFQQFLQMVFRPEVAGVSLVLVAVITLLSLITDSRGQVTGAWVDLLRQLFGGGIWLFPLVLAAIGLWMVIRAIERMDDLPWQRPVGLLLLFVAYLMGVTLYRSAEQPDAGGWTGRVLSDTISLALGSWGAWAFVAFLAFTGVVLLADQLLVKGGPDLWNRMREGWFRMQDARSQPTINPALPLPSGRLPWWKQMIQDWNTRGQVHDPTPNLVRPHATSTPSATQPRTDTPPSAAPPPTGQKVPLTQASQESDLIAPRIVGDGQDWRLPKLDTMLSDWDRQVDSDDLIRTQGRLIQETLALFGVPADFEGRVQKARRSPQYLIKPGYVERTVQGEKKRMKVKVNKIAALSNDLALALAASSVRIEAPIPGTTYVGVEVPNHEANVVGLKELMQSDAFVHMKGRLRIALGEDVKGQPIVADMTRMPHLLIAGATGSGKSVCINSIITCLLLTHTPDTLRLLMVDPKMVELSVYNGVPHLLSPVVTEVDKAAGVLFWAVKEMERRYQLASKANARDLERYNAYLVKRGEKPLPYIVVVVDEMADLMMAAPEEVEKHICRLAQMARAVGIHLIIATQRPSVDVITGLIKANFPARIAFAVTSQIDSRVILDIPGAERLLGRGDMLFMAPDTSKLERLQGTYLHDDEITRVVRYWRACAAWSVPASSRPAASPMRRRQTARAIARPRVLRPAR
ncbi:MAG: DNA translocase FtsK, partial [Caldilineaceae bacterium]|nr:DNA translocase FtsK [Caldilineaceae bacterium]